jgi:hypothetical protein
MALLDNLESIGEAVKQVREAELKIEMQNLVIQTQDGVLTLQDELRAKQQKIDELEQPLRTAESVDELLARVELRNNSYWTKDDPRNGPYCVKCVHSKGRLNPLLRVATTSAAGRCSVCGD